MRGSSSSGAAGVTPRPRDALSCRTSRAARRPCGARSRRSSSTADAPRARSDLPGAVADQRDGPILRIEARDLELRAADHHVEVDGGAVQAAHRLLRARADEAGTERDVRGRVLVEERVEVDATGLTDARPAVDECDLPEPATGRVGVEVRGDEIAVRLRVGVE